MNKTKQRQWNDLQAAFAKRNLQLMSFNDKELPQSHWQVYLEEEEYQSPLSANVKKLSDDYFRKNKRSTSPSNKDLQAIFLPEVKQGMVNWKVFQKQLKLEGLFIPESDITQFPIATIEAHAHLYQLLIQSNFFSKIIKDLKRNNVNPDKDEPIYLMLFLWNYFRYLSVLFKEKQKEELAPLKLIFFQPIDVARLDQLLPSEQIWTLMQRAFYDCFFEEKSSIDLKVIKEKLWPAAKTFVGRNWSSILLQIEHGFKVPTSKRKGGILKNVSFKTNSTLTTAFQILVAADLKYIQIQELLDNASGENILNYLPHELIDRYSKPLTESFQSKFNNLQKRKSIFQRIKADTQSRVQKDRIELHPSLKNWIEPKVAKWYELSEPELKDLAKAIKKIPNDLAIIAERRRKVYLKKLADETSMPFIQWNIGEWDILPQWNAIPEKTAKPFLWQFTQNQIRFKEESERLLQELKKLEEFTIAEHIISWKEKHMGFSFTVLQERWESRVKSQLRTLKNKEAYRYQRMVEFGILKAGERIVHEHNIWLDELLKIEQEVSPFLAFAKSSFKMALPSRTTVEFDPYRHSWDGIEFDPATIQDRRKWMRGDVMKQLKTKVSRASAEQINVFLLDYSGSMRGERMRNVFKIIYLLVLGLESRKTFDAYHFFGSTFLQGADFSSQYSNRSILFQILKKVAKIHRWKIIYSGAGGTNISGGVEESHLRMTKFAEQLREMNPGTFYFTSIFVITDGVPSVGIRDEVKLGHFIEEKRKEGDVAIKGLYLKPEGDTDYEFMEEVFGKDNYVVSTDLAEAINQLVYITSSTYKLQRKELKYAKRKAKH